MCYTERFIYQKHIKLSMECPRCLEDKDRLGQHWAMSCDYPELSEYKKNILTGLLMGDGHVPKTHGNSQMRIRMINKEFLDWLDQELSYLSSGVRFIKSADDSAKQMRDSGFRPNAKKENYNDVWELNTRTHPYITNMRENWYVPEKSFNLDIIDLNKDVIKMWYVTDGYLCDRDGHNPYSAFRMDSQSGTASEISKELSSMGFNNSVRDGGNVIAISPLSTIDLLDWIGDAPDGFEYKWVNKDE